MMSAAKRTFAVAQLGARMHYAVSRILHRNGCLGRLYTDLLAPARFARALGKLSAAPGPAALRRMAGRVPPDLPPALITAFPGFGFAYAARLRLATSPAARTAAYLWAGRELCRRVLLAGLDAADSVYTYNTAGLELMQFARRAGLRCVLEQTIAPASVERRLLDREHDRFSTWEPRTPASPESAEYERRERAEWDLADVILCGSDFVREGILAAGGPFDRCVVVPYGVDANRSARPRAGRRPLRVLTVGTVSLRKGAPYVLETARILSGSALFRMVGPIGISVDAQQQLARHVELVGPVPRSEVARHYTWADVFLLPSICEGSATVCYEAMAAGLPVIATPNAGTVVRDGIDGYIVPPGDAPAIAECITRFLCDAALLRTASSQALERAAQFDLDAYGTRLLAALAGAEEPVHA
jgi:glycosyltransferase involved in cell wall biosynthesis